MPRLAAHYSLCAVVATTCGHRQNKYGRITKDGECPERVPELRREASVLVASCVEVGGLFMWLTCGYEAHCLVVWVEECV